MNKWKSQLIFEYLDFDPIAANIYWVGAGEIKYFPLLALFLS